MSLLESNGTNNTVDDTSFESSLEISSELSDELDITNFKTNIESTTQAESNVVAFYRFEEGSGTNCSDSTINNLLY